MKKTFLLIACFLISASAFAQKVNLGLKIAPGLSWFKTDTKGFRNDGSKIGFSYGAVLDVLFTDNYGIASGLFISHQGGKMQADMADSSGNTMVARFDYKLQYLNIPVSLLMRTNEIGYMKYFGVFGVVPGINIGAKGTYEINNSKSDIEDAKDDIKSFNLALRIGGGVLYNFSGNTNLMVGIEWNNGFSDLTKESDLKITNNFLLLNLGVMF